MGVRTDVPFSELTDAGKATSCSTAPPRRSTSLYKAKKSDTLRRAGLHLLQRRLHRGERAGQGEGREGHEARGTLPQAGHLPRVPRHAPVRAGALKPQAARASTWPRPAEKTLDGPDRAGWTRVPGGLPERDAPDGARTSASRSSTRRAGSIDLGLGYLCARPRGLHALHRRAAARAAGPRRAQPHHRRALRAGRAVHRAAPGPTSTA